MTMIRLFFFFYIALVDVPNLTPLPTVCAILDVFCVLCTLVLRRQSWEKKKVYRTTVCHLSLLVQCCRPPCLKKMFCLGLCNVVSSLKHCAWQSRNAPKLMFHRNVLFSSWTPPVIILLSVSQYRVAQFVSGVAAWPPETGFHVLKLWSRRLKPGILLPHSVCMLDWSHWCVSPW